MTIKNSETKYIESTGARSSSLGCQGINGSLATTLHLICNRVAKMVKSKLLENLLN